MASSPLDEGPTRAGRWTDACWRIVAPCRQGGGTVRPRPERLSWPLLAATGRRLLVGGQADLFDGHVPLPFIARVFGVMARARQHSFQVLTRHPHRAQLFLHWLDRQSGWLPARPCPTAAPAWPLPNVWLGVRAGDAREVQDGLRVLLRLPVAVRWLLLDRPGPELDLTALRWPGGELPSDARAGLSASLNALTGCIRHAGGAFASTVARLDWVVLDGGAAATSIALQCTRARVPLYCTGDRALGGSVPGARPRSRAGAGHSDRRCEHRVACPLSSHLAEPLLPLA